MPTVLFVVHGMGRHVPGWSEEVIAKLGAVGARYPGFRARVPDGALASAITIREIVYDQCFRSYVEGWQENVGALREFVELNEVHAGHPIDVERVLHWLATDAAPDEQRFFWSHAVDVLLYRFFPIVADEVRATVVAQLADGLKGTNISAWVMAHSLGTKVAHDSLHELGTDGRLGGAFLAGNGFAIDGVFTLANVGRILGATGAGDPDPYDSIVHPITTPTSASRLPGYCVRFYDFRHLLDPFTLVRPFAPSGWGDDLVATVGLRHIAEDWNVHGLTHFLDHPAVHIPILNALLSRARPLIPDEEAAAAIANYTAPSLPPCQGAVQQLIDGSAELAASIRGQQGDPLELVRAIARWYPLVEKARRACR